MAEKYKIPTVEELLEAGVHFGHQARRWHPKMEDYIFDKRNGIHIIDLYKTHELLKNACDFLYEVASKGGQIVFVGTKKQAKDIIELEAKRSGAMYMNDRWIGGTITNFQTIRKNIDKLKSFMKKKETGELAHYTKKERLLIDREVEKLQRSVGGILPMSGRPNALFVVDARREKTAVREAKRQQVPVAALIDTNSDPEGISYVICGNDDAIRSIALVVKVVSDAVEAGYKEFAKVAEGKKEKVEKEVELAEEEVIEVPEELIEEAQKKEAILEAKVEEVIPVKTKEDELKPEEKKRRGRPRKE